MPSKAAQIWIAIGLIGIVVFCAPVDTDSVVDRKNSANGHQKESGAVFNKESTENRSYTWFYTPSRGAPKGIAVVLHGLNLRPAKMASIIKILTEAKIDALRVSLFGHGQNCPHTGTTGRKEARIEALKTVSYRLWREETYQAYCLARRRSDQFKVPLFLVGFSLGGLLGTDLSVSRTDVRFDRMVLFAPALDLKGILYSAKLLSLFPRLVIPSRASNSYRENSGLPMAAYNALFEALRHFKKNASGKLNVPTILFIDKQDELISYRGLKQFVKRHRLNDWSFHLVKKGKAGVTVKMHHLIIDKSAVGDRVWQEIRETMISHLLL